MTREELKQHTIGVLMGGVSAEREISLRTGNAILTALLGCGYKAIGIDADRDLPARLLAEGVEVAFIALHGRGGEDGSVQGLLETMCIPYTGSGILASSLALDKVMTKRILLQHGLPTPRFDVYNVGDDMEAVIERIRTYPVIAKPAREGSTIGVTIAADAEALRQGLTVAAGYDRQVVIEEFIKGRETTVSVLDGVALPIIEVVPKSGFYDFTSKYTAGQTEYLLPAEFEAPVAARMQQIAVDACQTLGCSGAARVDFMVRGDELLCLEVNTIPGMTATSLLPKAAAVTGIDFGELVQRILDGAGLDK
jgi:D-alanine-D-alanine ligase